MTAAAKHHGHRCEHGLRSARSEHFLGGRMKLDKAKAERVLQEKSPSRKARLLEAADGA
jgi:hypothetical protein